MQTTYQSAFAFSKTAMLHSRAVYGAKEEEEHGKQLRVVATPPQSSGQVNNYAVNQDDAPSNPRGKSASERARGRQRALDLPAPSAAEQAQKLRNKALRMLTTREHSREELMRKLAQAKARNARRFAETHDRDTEREAKDNIESLIDQLAAQGWQSDERYADALVRRLTGQASRRYIADKLAQVGIKKEVSSLALESLEQDDREIARLLWERRFGAAPQSDKERQRHIRFLLSRGFHLSDAFKIVPKVSTDRDTDNQ
jgi:regulatory protein